MFVKKKKKRNKGAITQETDSWRMDGRKEGRKEEGECSREEEGRDGLVEQLLSG